MKVLINCVRRIAAVAVGIGLIAVPILGMASEPPRVFPRDEVAYGKTYGDWVAAWWQWAVSLPAGNHPLFDTAPGCGKGQSGPVYFLGGKFCSTDNPSCSGGTASRTCSVPRGKALFFPILNVSCNSREAELGACPPAKPIISEMRAWTASLIAPSSGFLVTVDGSPVTGDLKNNFRLQSPVFDVVVPAFPNGKNLYQAIGETGVTAGRYFTVDDGIYVMLKPLPAGSHTLNFRGSVGDFSLDVTYQLTIE